MAGPTGPREEHLDRPRPAALQQRPQLVGPARGQRADVVDLTHRVVRSVGVGGQLDQPRLVVEGPRPHHQAVAPDVRHGDDGAGAQRVHDGRCPGSDDGRPDWVSVVHGSYSEPPSRATSAGPPGQVRLDPHLVEHELPRPLGGHFRLCRRQLDDHGRGPPDPAHGLLQHGLHVGQARCPAGARPGDQRPPRLGPHLGLEPRPLVRAHVGRVRHHQVDAAAPPFGQGTQPTPLDQLDAGQPTARTGDRPDRLQVDGRHLERAGTGVGGPHLVHHAGPELGGQRQRDGAGAGPGVDHDQPRRPRRAGARLVQAPGLTQRHLDHPLGFGPGDEDPRIDAQVQPAERPVAQDVLQRLPRRPARRHGPGSRGRTGRHRPGPRPARDRRERTHLVDDEAGLMARPADHRRQLLHQRTGRHVARRLRAHRPSSSSPPSWRPRLSAISASVSSSRSPASTWSSL